MHTLGKSLRLTALVCLVIFPALAPSSGAAEKSVRIFNLISLGEPVNSVLDRMGKPDVHKKNLLGWYKKGPGSGISVIAHEGRVAAVAASYFYPSWAKFNRLEIGLINKFGPPENFDYFPRGANTTARKTSAIGLGKGRAFRKWILGPFTVGLFWARPRTLILRYDHPALWKSYLKKKYGGPRYSSR